jgi:cellulose synthase operon protein B
MEAFKAENHRWAKLIVIAAVCLVITGLVPGMTVRTAMSEVIRMKLSRITPAVTADLTGLNDSINLKVPIPERWRIVSARLNLAYYHSTALLSERSRLVVRLNGIALAQVDLEPRSPEGMLEVDLPPMLLLADYNDLTITAALNYTYECQDLSSKELWANLRLDDSYLELDYSLKDVPPVLSSIADFLFDPKTLDPPKIHLVLPDYEPQTLRRAALASSAVALRYEYRPVEISVSNTVAPEKDNIVIGPTDFVIQTIGLSKDRFPPGNMGLLPLDGSEGRTDHTHAIIFMTGETPEAIDTAVRAFSILNFPWPDAASTTVTDVKIPEITKYSGKGLLEPGQSYRFEDLGLDTGTLRGFKPAPMETFFRLPSDFLAKANDKVKIFIHLAYSPGLRPDSALHVYLNNKFIGGISLNNPQGGRYDAFQVQVPTSMLEKGLNTLTCQPVLIPLESGPCAINQPDAFMVTLFGDSRIEIPPLEQWVAMPDIRLLFQDGFPYTTWPDWRTGIIIPAEKDPATVAAALNLVAMISQKTGILPFNLDFSYDLSGTEKKDVLVIGSMAAMPETIRKSSPLASRWVFPFITEIPTMKMIRERLLPTESSSGTTFASQSAELITKSSLNPDKLLLAGFESPVSPGHTVVLAGAVTPRDVLTGISGLWDPAVQAQCRENLVLIDYTGDKAKVWSQRTGPRYYTGRLSRLTWLDRVTHNYPLAFYGVIIVVIFLAAVIIYRLLKRVRRKRLSAGGGAT